MLRDRISLRLSELIRSFLSERISKKNINKLHTNAEKETNVSFLTQKFEQANSPPSSSWIRVVSIRSRVGAGVVVHIAEIRCTERRIHSADVGIRIIWHSRDAVVCCSVVEVVADSLFCCEIWLKCLSFQTAVPCERPDRLLIYEKGKINV